LPKANRLGDFRHSTLSWCRRTRISAPHAARDREQFEQGAPDQPAKIEKSHLVLTKKAGNMKLFLNDLDDLHQWDFIHNQKMVKEIERLRVLLATIEQQRESWKVRALMAEAQLLEATAKTSNNSRCQNVSDVRYALRRPDRAISAAPRGLAPLGDFRGFGAYCDNVR
jgi:hypothetical protein